ncbi:MAG: hypothetical protein WA840_15355 [Caulobacteraceae bacterium]
MGHHGSGLQKIMQVAFGLSIAFFGTSSYATLFGNAAGAVFS